jgi:hypothetical protein
MWLAGATHTRLCNPRCPIKLPRNCIQGSFFALAWLCPKLNILAGKVSNRTRYCFREFRLSKGRPWWRPTSSAASKQTKNTVFETGETCHSSKQQNKEPIKRTSHVEQEGHGPQAEAEMKAVKTKIDTGHFQRTLSSMLSREYFRVLLVLLWATHQQHRNHLPIAVFFRAHHHLASTMTTQSQNAMSDLAKTTTNSTPHPYESLYTGSSFCATTITPQIPHRQRIHVPTFPSPDNQPMVPLVVHG